MFAANSSQFQDAMDFRAGVPFPLVGLYSVSLLTSFRLARWEDARKALLELPDDCVNKHVILVATYSRLAGLKSKNSWEESQYRDLAISEGLRAVEYAKRTNHRVGIAQLDLVVAYIYRNKTDDIKNAYKCLGEAKKYSPNNAVIDYDLAGLLARDHKFSECMDSLENAGKRVAVWTFRKVETPGTTKSLVC
jgi:hypothetical protein